MNHWNCTYRSLNYSDEKHMREKFNRKPNTNSNFQYGLSQTKGGNFYNLVNLKQKEVIWVWS